MDRIDLPFVSGDLPLGKVFDRMAESRVHAAIVVLPGQEPVLVTNRAVDEAMEQGLTRVSEVPGAPLHVVESRVEDWGSILRREDASYGMEHVRGWGLGDVERGMLHPGEVPLGEMVTIVTRHESLAADIRNAGEVCRCRRNHRAPKGRPCPICRSEVRCA